MGLPAGLQQPRDVRAVPALGDLLRSDAVLPHEIVRGVGRWCEHRCTEPFDQALRIAFVPRCSEHHHRLAVGRGVEDLLRRGERVEEDQPQAVVECVGRDQLRPPLLRRPLGMGRLPVPEPGLNLAHRAQVSVYSGPEPPSGGVSRPPLAVIAPHWTQFDGVTSTPVSVAS